MNLKLEFETVGGETLTEFVSQAWPLLEPVLAAAFRDRRNATLWFQIRSPESEPPNGRASMPRICSICSHARRKDIDREITAPGASNSAIARTYGICRDAVRRHRPHISRTIAKATDAREITRANSLVDQLVALTAEAQRIAAKAEQAAQYSAAIGGLREMARIVELIAKLTGQLDEGTRVNVLVQEREAREADQVAMLYRLSLDERRALRRLIAKAQDEAPAPLSAEDVPVPTLALPGPTNDSQI
jgi:transposase-like protein